MAAGDVPQPRLSAFWSRDNAPVTPDGPPRRAGESSTAGSIGDRTESSGQSRVAYDHSNHDHAAQSTGHDNRESPGWTDRTRARHRHRSGGAFLLQDSVGGDTGLGRRSRGSQLAKGKGSVRTPDQRQSHASRGSASKSGSDGPIHNDAHVTSSPQSYEHSPKASTADSAKGDPSDGSSPSNARASLDADSTQIIHMALNLSESRRLASRRNISRSNPPRLAPIPDSGSKSNLRQHLQQQRRASRTGSPRPRQGSSPRIPSSSHRANSPLQAMLDGQDGAYHYHFSESTLARAQKAKDHLELMEQYRRLLDHLPPLKPDPSSDPALARSRTTLRRGRPYNPLQYIRNRKVRARERRVIDGEQLGFGFTELVRTWVDQVSQQSSGVDGQTFTMPSFIKADEAEKQISPDAKAAMRVRRPRVDWFFDPCDMIADAYWLEQDHHKHLIEDRFLRRIFPPVADASRPASRQAADAVPTSMLSHAKTIDVLSANELHSTQTDSLDPFVSQLGSRERAKQKLQDMRGFHHRHTSSHGHHDLLGRRDSISDTSDSEPDIRGEKLRKVRTGRRDTISSDANDLLQKQMIDIVAQEAREKELSDLIEHPDENQKSFDPTTPENKQQFAKQPGSHSHSRKASLAGSSDTESRKGRVRSRLGSPTRYYHNRPSLEVPEDTRHGFSHDLDVSAPTSPQLTGNGDHVGPPPFGLDLSVPSSRAGSPTRNPLSKVKRKLLDRSRDNGAESQSEAEDDADARLTITETPSPSDKFPSRAPEDGLKVRRESASARAKEESVGLRGIFKGTVIRGGVSKIGDIIWKKDAGSDTDSDSSSDSEADATRGRSRPSLSRATTSEVPPNAKHYLDSMPQFHHVGEATNKTTNSQASNLVLPELSRPQSRQSARWEQLKPPRIDIQSSVSTPAPSIAPAKRLGESDVSESESYQPSLSDEKQGASHHLEPRDSGLTSQGRSPSRHWSITDRNPSPERTRLSKREVARLRALIFSSGVKAMEINRRANELRKPLNATSAAYLKPDPRYDVGPLSWDEMIKIAPDCKELQEQPVTACEVYPLASKALGMAIRASGQRWQSSADQFATKTAPALQKRIGELRSRLADELSQMARQAADEADETNKGLSLDQPLKIKHVVDAMDTLLRQRRRRFRWMRRGLWLAVEWVLIGFMWYVWFVVMIFRIFLGVGRVAWNGVRWLLWL